MSAATLERVKQEATKVVKNLPDAHGSWQFWRNAAFRTAVRDVVGAVYNLRIEGFTDDEIDVLEDAVRVVIRIIDVHTSRLGTALRDTVDREYFAEMTQKLKIALEGLEDGFSPDPAKRPSDEELMQSLDAGLRRAKLV